MFETHFEEIFLIFPTQSRRKSGTWGALAPPVIMQSKINKGVRLCAVIAVLDVSTVNNPEV